MDNVTTHFTCLNVLVGEENAYKATCADQASKTNVTVLAILDPSESFTLGIKRGINSITLHPLLVLLHRCLGKLTKPKDSFT